MTMSWRRPKDAPASWHGWRATPSDIVLRELAIGPEHRRRETCSTAASCSHSDEDRGTLRWRLVNELRAGTLPLDRAEVIDYLRNSVVNQIAIDQPKYSGYATALANAGLAPARMNAVEPAWQAYASVRVRVLRLSALCLSAYFWGPR